MVKKKNKKVKKKTSNTTLVVIVIVSALITFVGRSEYYNLKKLLSQADKPMSKEASIAHVENCSKRLEKSGKVTPELYEKHCLCELEVVRENKVLLRSHYNDAFIFNKKGVELWNKYSLKNFFKSGKRAKAMQECMTQS